MALLELQNLQKHFGKTQVLRDLSLQVEEGQFVTLLGPSGCGKTTTLRIVAGLTDPDGGDVLLEGEKHAAAASGKAGTEHGFSKLCPFSPHERGKKRGLRPAADGHARSAAGGPGGGNAEAGADGGL